MSIATKAKKNKKRHSSRSQSRSPLPINMSSSLPLESTTLIIKRQLSKDHNRRSSPNDKHRPPSSSHHSSNRYRHRSPSNHDRHRSDVTLYLRIIRLTNLAIIFFTNRTFKKGVG